MSIDHTARIHPSAVIEDGARIGPGTEIGPFCVIGPQVVLGANVTIKSHVVVTGRTEIGDGTAVFPFTCLGEIPQDLKYGGEDTRLVIGARNRIREHVTMNPGTEGGGGITRVGDDGLFMAGVHVAHDCQLGDRVILVNNVGVAGHVTIGDDVIVGGISGVHQFVRIGRGAIIGGLTKVTKDVVPFGLLDTGAGDLRGLNLVGLRRSGVDRAEIAALRAAYDALAAGEGTFQDRARLLQEGTDSELVRALADFILAETDRNFHTPV
ncbi:acyl-ACP--UDP-N-acetylglucosamine O-acyltransferase [Psychromarinibacter sp. C21-152]|uniref:Acyl-[acyl-carrier-protein]--UDP-N-acetylglucosamine O-acyltransferase n=1 Tax=Psychromarinibacter sediminicola TaxID=3033385 RepID=A0AAE3NV79_9RHOB|nr:acyl-ACP--UDP-N-acetylglucosamine O-acyltransferase [Psychromarinibacter sediminicola]MDF0602264.1 acyl-ACP--UDP-N-acetylglucosamine O-acyltransferase [Psychromarinibacter sediminicola]